MNIRMFLAICLFVWLLCPITNAQNKEKAVELVNGTYDITALSFEGNHWGGRMPMFIFDKGKNLIVRPGGRVIFNSSGDNKGTFKIDVGIFTSELMADGSVLPILVPTRDWVPPAILEGSYELEVPNVLILRVSEKNQARMAVTCHLGTPESKLFKGSYVTRLRTICDAVSIGRPLWVLGEGGSSYYNGLLFSLVFDKPYTDY